MRQKLSAQYSRKRVMSISHQDYVIWHRCSIFFGAISKARFLEIMHNSASHLWGGAWIISKLRILTKEWKMKIIILSSNENISNTPWNFLYFYCTHCKFYFFFSRSPPSNFAYAIRYSFFTIKSLHFRIYDEFENNRWLNNLFNPIGPSGFLTS